MKGLVLSLLGGPIWVDAQAQRLVDAGMHALMRRGVRKAAIRYVIGRAAICALGAVFVASIFDGESHGVWLYVLLPAFFAAMAFGIRLEGKDDLKEEGASMPVRRRFDWTDRAWWWTFLLRQIWVTGFGAPPKNPADARIGWFAIILYMLLLLLAYSGKTPPCPPARKEKIAFTPARAGAGNP